jgi:hypothetical protein
MQAWGMAYGVRFNRVRFRSRPRFVSMSLQQRHITQHMSRCNLLSSSASEHATLVHFSVRKRPVWSPGAVRPLVSSRPYSALLSRTV